VACQPAIEGHLVFYNMW